MKIKILDIMIIVINLVLISIYTINSLNDSNSNSYLKVEVEGKEYLYPLNIDRTVTITGLIGETTIEINDGEGYVIKSACRNKTCIKMGHISRGGESAACLPNRVLLSVTGDNTGGVDAATY